MARYETRPSPITNYIWVVWDTKSNWFVYGSKDEADVRATTDRLNTQEPTVPASPEETE